MWNNAKWGENQGTMFASRSCFPRFPPPSLRKDLPGMHHALHVGDVVAVVNKKPGENVGTAADC
jgi:hypothetical protein